MTDAERERIVDELRAAISDVVMHRTRARLLQLAQYTEQAAAEGEMDREAWSRVRAAISRLAAAKEGGR